MVVPRIAGLLCLLCTTIQSNAGYIEAVKVRHHENYDVTPWKTVDVEFVTGTEIRDRVSGYFPFIHTYAIIPLQNERVIVLKLDGISLCSGEFRRSCFPLYENIRGYDKQGQAWEICTRGICP